MAFRISRGTNISHWLSQSDRRGAERRAWFGPADIGRIADWGFDHIRLPVDEEQMWDDGGSRHNEAFDLLDAALDWADQAGLNVVVDLHILRSHSFTQTDVPRLFTDPREGEKLAGMWRQLSDRMKRRSIDRVAYEVLNEAVAQDPNDWNRVMMMPFKAVRDREPERTIVMGSNRWNSVFTFNDLYIPDDRNVVLTCHYYHPMFVTHYRASWWPEGGAYSGPIQYPGRPIPAQHLAELPEPARSKYAALNVFYDRSVISSDLAQPLAAAARTKLPLYCGEFGAISLAPQPIRLAWYSDIISVFNEHRIAWANWDYKGSFALIDSQGQSTGIAEVILGRA